MSQASNQAWLPCRFDGGLLRRLRPADLADFQAYRAIPELGRYQGWTPMPRDEAQAFLAEMTQAPLFAPGVWIQLGIAEPSTERLVGDIGIRVSDDGQAAEIGFTLEPGSQGRGIATAAVRAATRLLFEATPVQRVRGITDHRNGASVRLLERLGFRLEDRRDTVFRGEPCTELVYVWARSDG